MTKTAAEAEREVEASRGELDRTVEALKDRMTPGQLFDEAMRTMSDSGNLVLAKLADQAKANPLPLAVIGAGVAWLLATSGPKTAEARAFAPPRRSGDGLSEKARSMQARASDALGDAQQGLAGAMDGVRDSVQSAQAGMSKFTSGASAAMDQAGDYGRQARGAMMDLMDREPLLIGGAGLLIGLALGSAMPTTEAEKRTLGPAADRMIEKGRSFAQDRLEDVQERASAAFDATKEAATKPEAAAPPTAPIGPSTQH